MDVSQMSEEERLKAFVTAASMAGVPYDQIQTVVDDYRKNKKATQSEADRAESKAEKADTKAQKEADRLAGMQLANDGDYEAYNNLSASDKVLFKEAGGKVPQSPQDQKTSKAEQEEKKQFEGVSRLMLKLKDQAKEVGVTDKPGNMLGLNSKISQFNSTKKLALQMLAKKIEGGRLSDSDRKFYQDQIANISPYGLSDPKNEQVFNLVENLGYAAGIEDPLKDIQKDPDVQRYRSGQSGNNEISKAGSGLFDMLVKQPINTINNLGKDFGAGITANMTGGSRNQANDQATQQAMQLEQAASQSQDPEEQKQLLAQATQLRQRVGQSAGEVGKSFSPDINDSYLMRSLLGGATIAGAAEIPGLASGVKTLATKGAGVASTGGRNSLSFLKSLNKPKYDATILNKADDLITEATRLRNQTLETAQGVGSKVNGDRIYNSIAKELKLIRSQATESEKKLIDDQIRNFQRIFKGKNLNPTTAQKRWDYADKGFTQAGNLGKTAESEVHRLIRDAIRPALDEAAPGWNKANELYREGFKLAKKLEPEKTRLFREDIREGMKSPIERFVSPTAKRVVQGVGAGAGFYGLSKLFPFLRGAGANEQ